MKGRGLRNGAQETLKMFIGEMDDGGSKEKYFLDSTWNSYVERSFLGSCRPAA